MKLYLLKCACGCAYVGNVDGPKLIVWENRQKRARRYRGGHARALAEQYGLRVVRLK